MEPRRTQNRPPRASWAAGGAQVATKAALRPPFFFGGSWGRLGAVLGRSWRLLGPSWASRGAPGNNCGLPAVSWESFLGHFLKPPWKIANTLKNNVFSMVFKVFLSSRDSKIDQTSLPNRSQRPLGGRRRPKKHPRAANRDQKAAKSAPKAPQERPQDAKNGSSSYNVGLTRLFSAPGAPGAPSRARSYK